MNDDFYVHPSVWDYINNVYKKLNFYVTEDGEIIKGRSPDADEFIEESEMRL